MNELDVYYRAFTEYRRLTSESRECNALRNAIACADTENDSIIITGNICTVDEDWIEEIERGLVFIEKAIHEERQFIYSNGDVLPIEKVKHVSKDSVEHLARHSNLITREPAGDDLIPDKLYSVERLNDYAVYENRFLYMLLCYLREFVTIRYNKILELSNKYEGKLKLRKEISLPKRSITFSVELQDVRKDDEYLKSHNSAKSAIDRMDLILKTVISLINTPLMEYAAKAAMLKPPITKTNVLKMDNNFKGALALYDYIIAYEKPGYTVEYVRKELAPFGDGLADEIAEAGALLSFLTYEHGMDLSSALKNRYEAEEEVRRLREIARGRERLDVLKKKLAEMNESPDEYILGLERQIKLLQSELSGIRALRERINACKELEEALRSELRGAQLQNAAMQQKISESKRNRQEEINLVRAEYNELIHSKKLQHEREMKELEGACNDRIELLSKDMRDKAELVNDELSRACARIEESENELELLSEKYDTLLEEKRLCEARIKSLRLLGGDSFEEDEFTDKAGFDELEKELEAFVSFYESRWGIVKKKIRKKLLNFETLKGQKRQN